MKNDQSDPVEAIALFRFGLISKVQELNEQPMPLKTALESVSCVPHLTSSGQTRIVPFRTLEDWWYAYKHEGFSGLRPKSRSDRGVPRVLSSEQEEYVLAAVRAQPGIAVKVLYRQWKEQDPKLPSLGTVYRVLQHNDLNQRSRRYLLRQSINGPTKTFEAPLVNDLWMVDFSPGPFLQIPGKKKALATHLCVIIDDHSRLVPYAAYYENADTRAFHHSFKEAIIRRGLPHKLYTDQGGPFISDHTRVICANLGVRLLHAKPYHAWSKGKVERFIKTLQNDFEAGLRANGVAPATLEELNHPLADWLEKYHHRHHEGIGMSPTHRFTNGAHHLRPLDPTLKIAKLFYNRLHRVVRKDGTVRLDNQLYEVDLALRGLEVRLRFDPWTMESIEVDYRGQSFGLARKVDPHLNYRLHDSEHYQPKSKKNNESQS